MKKIEIEINDKAPKSSQIGMALALLKAISKSGGVFVSRDVEPESLRSIKRLIDEEVEWQDAPNNNKGGH